jgi:iron(III) transport system permease protein
MSRWRITVALLLGTLCLPLFWPIGSALDLDAWPDLDTLHRLVLLGETTLALVGLTLALAIPAGVVGAILLERTDLPGRRLFGVVLLGTLFVPLPLFTSAWQVVLSLLQDVSAGEWAPWSQGLVSAAWIHAVAGLPWVVLLVAWGLRGVERDLEEDASMLLGPLGVLWHVTLPRCAASIAAAAVWVAFQTSTEITVTDVMQVRTAAEEVYTQLLLSPEATSPPLARAVTASLGQVLVSLVLVLVLARHAERLIPGAAMQLRPAAMVPLGRWRWPLALLVGCLALGLTAVPVGGLLWRAGLAGLPPEWSPISLMYQFTRTVRADRGTVLVMLGVVGVAGGVTATLALVSCWLAREARWFRVLLLVLAATAWAMPGPVIGLGLKKVIRALLDATGWPGPLASLLWYGPSYLPLLWVDCVRFLPFATAFLWPLIRLLPRELFEAARLDGARPRQELAVLARMVWPAWLRAALATAILSLGELSAGKLVSTPGAESYAEMVFTQMHYGVTATLAAQCLLLLAVVLAAVVLFQMPRFLSLLGRKFRAI